MTNIDPNFEVNENDKHQEHHLYLYNNLFKKVNIDNKKILEVGCGFGGGAYYLTTYKNTFKNYTGVDLSFHNIKNNKHTFHLKKLSFKVGDAMNLKLEENNFDVVFNLESSHCYGDYIAFLSGVDKVLKKGGFFCYSDYGDDMFFKSFYDFFTEKNYKTILNENISKEVIDSLKINDHKFKNHIDQPTLIKNFFSDKFINDAIFNSKSDNYQKLLKEELKYKTIIIQK